MANRVLRRRYATVVSPRRTTGWAIATVRSVSVMWRVLRTAGTSEPMRRVDIRVLHSDAALFATPLAGATADACGVWARLETGR
ncbi:hypothetical protein RKD23_000121 [Streptomyces sp. SAI-170]|uniref:hypothetical protein n=1 Tax=Streptomyces sp. SAI-170 TaxID=3377729 RepID=UPI003C7B5E7E